MSTAYYELQPSGDTDDKFNRNYTRKFLVDCAATNTDAVNAISIVPIARYDAYPYDSFALCTSAKADPVPDQPGKFEVSFEYTSRFDSEDGTTSDTPGDTEKTDPTIRVPKIKFSTVNKTKVFETDFNTVPLDICNSNKQPYDPPMEVETNTTLITISNVYFNFSKDIYQKKAYFCNKLNKFALSIIGGWTDFPIGTVKCNDYNAESEYINGLYYWHCEIVLEYNPDGWSRKVANMGTYEFTPGSMSPPPYDAYTPIYDSMGNPVTSPVPLDDNGKKLATYPPFTYKTYKPYDSADFATLLS